MNDMPLMEGNLIPNIEGHKCTIGGLVSVLSAPSNDAEPQNHHT